MATEIIVSIIFGVASIVSSVFFGLVPNLRKEKIERLEKKIERMARDIDSFFAIEEELLVELSQVKGVKPNSKRNEIRRKVREQKNWELYSTPAKNKKEFQ